MHAIKPFDATYNGVTYRVKKGQSVDGLPPALVAQLKRDGIVAQTRTKKETTDD